jgi:hypothetical protein
VAVWFWITTDDEESMAPVLQSNFETEIPKPASVLRTTSPDFPTNVMLKGKTPLLGVDFIGCEARLKGYLVTAKLAINPAVPLGLPLTDASS